MMKKTSKTVSRRNLLVKSAQALACTSLISSKALAIDPSSFFHGGEHEFFNGTQWRGGGTTAMRAHFPPRHDPFISGLGNACRLQEETIIGPCYFDLTDTRDDISEGQPGVPMSLALKLVDANCMPVKGAKIEVWWCNSEGVYSGDTSESTNGVGELDEYTEADGIPKFITSMCSGEDSEALASRWFRGIKTTDGVGNVYFKACLPGWYPMRAPHIHVRVVRDGEQKLSTQLAFDDELVREIYLNHPDYTGIEQDTTNSSDMIFSELALENHMVIVERQFDGSMLAYKALQINS